MWSLPILELSGKYNYYKSHDKSSTNNQHGPVRSLIDLWVQIQYKDVVLPV